MSESLREAAVSDAIAPKGPPVDHIRQVFVDYARHHSAGDVDAILSLFADDAVIRDPVDQPEIRGKAAIGGFFRAGIEQSGGPLEMKLDGAVRIAGNQGAAGYIIRTVNASPVFRVESMDVMTFNEEGLITRMDAYWGPSNFTQEG